MQDWIKIKSMKTKPQSSTKNLINISNRDSSFVKEVKRRSGVNINLCWHCQSCAGGCPFVSAMDYPPNRVIRLVQLGLKKLQTAHNKRIPSSSCLKSRFTQWGMSGIPDLVQYDDQCPSVVTFEP